jgi:hypothetical protein
VRVKRREKNNIQLNFCVLLSTVEAEAEKPRSILSHSNARVHFSIMLFTLNKNKGSRCSCMAVL